MESESKEHSKMMETMSCSIAEVEQRYIVATVSLNQIQSEFDSERSILKEELTVKQNQLEELEKKLTEQIIVKSVSHNILLFISSSSNLSHCK